MLLLVLAACGSDGDVSGTFGGGVTNAAGTIQLDSTTYDITEGAVVNILVTRSGGSSGVASVDYATSDGTAVAGTDYPATSGTLTFADGVSGNQTISIPISDDSTAEVTEAFTLTLSNVSGATLGMNSSATVNIVNVSAGLPITDDHARAISEEVLRAVTWPGHVIDLLDLIGLPVIINVTPAEPESRVVTDVSTNVVDCDSGEVTITWDDADNNLVISTGDTFDVVSERCRFADTGMWFSGAMTITNLVVSGDPFNQVAPWGLGLSVGLEALPVSGDLDLDVNSEDNVLVARSIATASLRAADASFNAHTLSDYMLTETLDLNALTRVGNVSGTFTNPYRKDAVVFETLRDFVIMADENPSAGQLLISDNSSSVLITALDNINVQLEIDIDLDGTIDQTIVVTWAELDIDLGT
jgi:hypothetical protein